MCGLMVWTAVFFHQKLWNKTACRCFCCFSAKKLWRKIGPSKDMNQHHPARPWTVQRHMGLMAYQKWAVRLWHQECQSIILVSSYWTRPAWYVEPEGHRGTPLSWRPPSMEQFMLTVRCVAVVRMPRRLSVHIGQVCTTNISFIGVNGNNAILNIVRDFSIAICLYWTFRM